MQLPGSRPISNDLNLREDADSHALDYSRATVASRSAMLSRKFVRAIFITSLIAVIGVAGWRMAVRLRYFWWQQQCLTFSQPNDFVVFDSNLQSLPPLTSSAPRLHAHEFSSLNSLYDGRISDVVYLHERTSANGNRRLVVVAQPTDARELCLDLHSIVPSQWASKTQVTETTYFGSAGIDVHRVQRFKIFAGQSDPADAAHFTIRILADDQTKIIDGWLHDDGSLSLEPRVASAFSSSASQL